MKRYYVNNNAQANGDHEVHHYDCPYLNQVTNRTYLGEFPNCASAVNEAKIIHRQVNGCKTCNSACHTQ